MRKGESEDVVEVFSNQLKANLIYLDAVSYTHLAKKVEGTKIITVSSSQLKKGDVFVCEAGDVIPSDGEIIEGLASIDELSLIHILLSPLFPDVNGEFCLQTFAG